MSSFCHWYERGALVLVIAASTLKNAEWAKAVWSAKGFVKVISGLDINRVLKLLATLSAPSVALTTTLYLSKLLSRYRKFSNLNVALFVFGMSVYVEVIELNFCHW